MSIDRSIYLSIYICCRVRNLSTNCLFWVNNLSKCPCFSLFVFKNIILSAGRTRFKKKKTKRQSRQTITIFWVKNLSDYVAQHAWTHCWLNLGQIFDSTFFTCLAFSSFLKICWNPYYMGINKNSIFVAHPPKIRNTICEHNYANWLFVLFSAFLAFWVFAVSGILGGNEWKSKKTKLDTQPKKERRPQDANKKTI